MTNASLIARASDATSLDRSGVVLMVAAAGQGDGRAWGALVEHFGPTVWAIVRGYRLSEPDAADVFHATWLRLLDHLDGMEQPDRVGAWLATTARRECVRFLRLHDRPSVDGHYIQTRTEHPTDSAVRTTVNALVDGLPLRARLLLRLVSAESPLTYCEISESLGIPVGSIGPTRARALEQVRRRAAAAGIKLEDVFFT